jgi:peptide/nickel transport system substrate-binding protein
MSAGRGWRRGIARRSLVIGTAAVAALTLSMTVLASGSNARPPSAHAAGTLSGLYGSLPPVGTPTKGGTITVSQLTGSTPNFIFPIVPSADDSTYTNNFIYGMFLPLYNAPNGGTPEINYAVSVATKPTFTDDDKTVTIHMRPSFKWSDGKPVDANDVIFFVDLVKQAVKESAANWSSYSPGLFPDSLASVQAAGEYTVVMHLKRAFNPGYFLDNQLEGLVTPLPSTEWNVDAPGKHLDYTVPANAKKIYDYLAKAGGQIAQFATNPLWKIVDGPLVLSSFNATNSSFVQKPNKTFGGSPKPLYSELDTDTYTGITPLFNALRTGSLDIGGIDFSQLSQVPTLRSDGYSVYGYPGLGWYGAIYNFKDKTDHFNAIIGQLYVRQALAHLENQPAYLKGIFKNAGVLAFGPVPSSPPTPFTPANAVNNPYPFNPNAAVALLESHGWKVVPNGQTTCAKAGTAANECGAGIPAGTPFKFTWFYIPPTTTPSSALESEAFASEAKAAAGIDIQLEEKTFNFIVTAYNDADPSQIKHQNEWGVVNFGGLVYDIYPTSATVFNTTGDLNTGGYSNPEADKLMNDSVYGSNPKAVTNEASFLTENQPVLFTPNTDLVYAVSKRVGGPASSFLSLTQSTTFPQYWYVTK